MKAHWSSQIKFDICCAAWHQQPVSTNNEASILGNKYKSELPATNSTSRSVWTFKNWIKKHRHHQGIFLQSLTGISDCLPAAHENERAQSRHGRRRIINT